MVKYSAPVRLINNLETFAQRLVLRFTPETKLGTTLSPAKNINRPITTLMCITSFCLDGAQTAIKPKIRIGRPNIAGM